MLEIHFQRAERALQRKRYGKSLREVRRALEAYDSSRMFDHIDLTITGLDVMKGLYVLHQPSREFVDELQGTFFGSPSCELPLRAQFHLRLLAATAKRSRLIAVLDSVKGWHDCSSWQRARLIWEFHEELSDAGSVAIAAEHKAGLTEEIEAAAKREEQDPEETRAQALFLFNSLLAAKRSEEALELATCWLCGGVPGLQGGDLSQLLEKHQVVAPQALVCPDDESPKSEGYTPPMTSSAAGEGKGDAKGSEEGQDDGDEGK